MYIHDGKQTLVDTWISQGGDYVSYQKVRRDDCFMLEISYNSPSRSKSFQQVSYQLFIPLLYCILEMNSTTIQYDLLQDIADPTIFQLPSLCL